MTLTESLSKIFVAGHLGMVGSAFIRHLHSKGTAEIITAARDELDLLDQKAVFEFLKKNRPDLVIIAAAKVGGIYANNTFRADFIYENLMIEANLIHGSHLADIDRLLFLGSSCIYPRDCPQPIREEYLLTGPLESTNEPYALAKIVGIKLCENYNNQHKRKYFSVMPTNLYGLNDNYNVLNSHVLPALIRKIHESKLNGDNKIIVWGSGTPKREFLCVDDLVDACMHLVNIKYNGPILNIGTGTDISINELAQTIMDIVGFKGIIVNDTTKPDGTPRKLLDVSRMLQLGWKAKTSLYEGVKIAYDDYVNRI